MALSLEVSRLPARHLVIGASSTSIFSRKNLSLGMMGDSHLSTTISENAPSFCSVYVVSDGKLQNLRPAESEPTVITVDNRKGSSYTSPDNFSGSSSLTIGRILKTSRPSSPRYPVSASSGSYTNPFQTGRQESKTTARESMEQVVFDHYTFQDTNKILVSQSSSSGDSESWVSEHTSPGGSFVGIPPPRSCTPPGVSFVGTPGGSYAGIPPTGSFAGIQPGSFVGTPRAVSFAETPPSRSYVGTTPAVSFAETPPSRSFVGIPPQGHSSAGFPASMTHQVSELEKLRIELRHIEKMYTLAQNRDINENLDGQSKERLEEALKLKKETSKEFTSTGKNKIQFEEKVVKSPQNSKRNSSRKKVESNPNHEGEETEANLKLASSAMQYQKFTWKEIVEATSSLSDEYKIGAGAFGTVYKCKLHHTIAAVKVLNVKNTTVNKQFLQELEILTTIRHPHLLLLLGAVPEESCLIYEYMENGSLEDRLLHRGSRPPLPWYDRFRICWEVAGALAFLHSTKPQPIIHRDLKPANILLDQNLVSKIGDAGLGTMINVEPTGNESLKTMYKETSPVGTLCYIDPEYQRTGRVSTKSDIYALGVVILQLLTAKPAVGIAYLIEDAIDEGTLLEVIDPEAGEWPENEVLELALLGLQCAELRGRDRPDLREKVLPVLERLKEVADSAREQASSAPAALPAHFICPIHKDIMEDPYVAADGYTYDRAAIEEWLAENNTSPTTNLPLPHKFIMPNTTLLEAIKQWKSKQSSK